MFNNKKSSLDTPDSIVLRDSIIKWSNLSISSDQLYCNARGYIDLYSDKSNIPQKTHDPGTGSDFIS